MHIQTQICITNAWLLDGGLSCKADETHRFTLIFLLYIHMSKIMTAPLDCSLTGEYCSFSPVLVTTYTDTYTNTHSGHREVRYRPAASVIPPSSRRPFQSHRHEFPHPSNRSGLKGQTHTHTHTHTHTKDTIQHRICTNNRWTDFKGA